MLKRISTWGETQHLVDILRRIEDIVLQEPGKQYDLVRGGKSDFYVDIKKAYGNPLVRRDIAQAVARHIDHNTSFVAVAGYGGLPLGSEISSYRMLSLTMVRDEPKDHGKEGMIDGYVPKPGERGVVVDDVVTSGGGIRKVRSVIAATGAVITANIAVVNRGDPTLEFDVGYLLRPEDIRATQ